MMWWDFPAGEFAYEPSDVVSNNGGVSISLLIFTQVMVALIAVAVVYIESRLAQSREWRKIRLQKLEQAFHELNAGIAHYGDIIRDMNTWTPGGGVTWPSYQDRIHRRVQDMVSGVTPGWRKANSLIRMYFPELREQWLVIMRRLTQVDRVLAALVMERRFDDDLQEFVPTPGLQTAATNNFTLLMNEGIAFTERLIDHAETTWFGNALRGRIMQRFRRRAAAEATTGDGNEPEQPGQ